MNTSLQQAIEVFIQQPHDVKSNFLLGYEYDRRGHIAAALSLYLRVAETTTDKDLQYECLIRNFLNISKQKERKHSATGQLLHAISVRPDRPEGYFLLSRYYEREQKWQETYTTAITGLQFIKHDYRDLLTEVEYPGEYALYFQKAVSAWWIGRCEESKVSLRWLMDNYYMNDLFATITRDNLIKLKGVIFPVTPYTEELHSELKFKFPGSHKIKKNFSQAYQDLFVLAALNGKKKGTYLEIGSGDPYLNSNTALLEESFQWKGVSVDIQQSEVDKFKAARKNQVYCQDAVATDYRDFLRKINLGKDLDFLQLDCDPEHNTYTILESIPFDEYRFAVIAYEHDYYCDSTKTYRDKSRKYLKEKGYELLVTNISVDKNSSYEDWWVHPELVDRQIINSMKNICDRTKQAQDYMLGSL